MKRVVLLTVFTAFYASRVAAAPTRPSSASHNRSGDIIEAPVPEWSSADIVQESSNGIPWLTDLPDGRVEGSSTARSTLRTQSSIITSTVYASVPVITLSTSSGTAQIIPTVTSSASKGSVITTLPTTKSNPLLTSSIPIPSSIIHATQPATSAVTEVDSRLVSANIFQPVATNAPPANIPVRTDHPAPRVGVKPHTGPIGTNKFYGNLMVGEQLSRVWTHPYTLAWAKGSNSAASSSYGLLISHDSDRRVFGPTQTNIPGDPVRYFVDAAGIESIVISAASLGASTTLTTDSITAFSVNVNLASSAGASPAITFPLVQGMGFVTGIYKTGVETPILQSNIFFKSLLKVSSSPKAGVTKYRITLFDGTNWLLYAYSTSGKAISFNLIDQTLIQGTSNFKGVIQIAKSGGTASEALYDAACGAYATGVTLSGSVSGSTGTYNLQFAKGGLSTSTLLMFALPHHVESFSTTTKSKLTTLQLGTSTKGNATAVAADNWSLNENLPTTMSFAPWSPTTGSKLLFSAGVTAKIRQTAISELSQDMNAQSNLPSVYGAGKALAKFAQIVYVMNDIVGDKATAQAGLGKLKTAFARWANNQQQYPFYYESAWGGLVSSASYATGDPNVDYGNTYYNDHHFHYGYFIYAASIIGHLDAGWLAANKAFVNALVRDIANPSTEDSYFPVYRNFDWYHGHSWAHGVTDYADGKDEESSSEDTMSAYALKMWGATTGDANLEARGNLQLAITARSLQNYFLYISSNTIQPPNFIGNKVSGIMFENKIDHVTYFGTNPEYIQGIHMIPLLPASALTRTKEFVKEEWATYFDNGRANAVQGGWKGILFANLALIDPVTAYQFFSSASFDAGWLDGGTSLTWYLALAAGLGGAS